MHAKKLSPFSGFTQTKTTVQHTAVKISFPTSAIAIARKKLPLSLLPNTGFIRAAKYK